MLKKITIKNFGCIQDLTLDCGFDQKQAPRGYQKADLMPFIQSGAGKETRVCAVQGLFGPNAVGKTTMLEALDCLQKAIYGIPFGRKYLPNRLKKGWDQKPVEMDVEVVDGGDCYRYQIAWDASSIVGESLRVNDREVFSVQNGVIQSLAGIPKRKQLRCSEDYATWWRVENGVAKRTFLSMLSGNKMGAKLGKAWRSIAYGWQVAQRDRSAAVSLRGLSVTFDGPTNDIWLQKAIAELPVFLHRLDSDIVEVKVIEEEPENLRSTIDDDDANAFAPVGTSFGYRIEVARLDSDKQKVWFDLEKEPASVRRLIVVLATALMAIREGSTLCIDNLDEALHPMVVKEIVRMFKLRRINPKGAQLIFTACGTDLLDAGVLDPWEISVVNRRGSNGSRLLRLSQIEPLVETQTIRRRYWRGDFGGIPFSYI